MHASSGKGRGAKRKNVHDGAGGFGAGGKKSKVGDGAGSRLNAHGYPIDHPFNKDVFRYILAEPDPHAPFR